MTKTPQVVDLAAELARVEQPWSPLVVATLNDYEVKVVRLLGDFVWHAHAETDELFLVLSGSLTIELREPTGERAVSLSAGQLFVVPHGVQHRPRAASEVTAVLIEPRGVLNTGDAG